MLSFEIEDMEHRKAIMNRMKCMYMYIMIKWKHVAGLR